MCKLKASSNTDVLPQTNCVYVEAVHWLDILNACGVEIKCLLPSGLEGRYLLHFGSSEVFHTFCHLAVCIYSELITMLVDFKVK